MSDQTIVDVVINDSTATVVDNRDLSNLTIDLNATGQLLTNNLISSGNYLDSEIAIVSGIAQSGSNESLTGQINQLSGNLITTGQTLQTQITSNDSDITSLTSNLVTTGQTLQTQITSNDSDITSLTSNLVTTGQTLQTQITSNDSDINTLTTNLATTGETLTSEINSISGVVPTGGATNQVLAKINSANYNTQWVDQGGGGSGTVTSSTATTNYLTKWTNGAGEVIGNSVAYDNGSNVGIGTASPTQKLQVGGTTIEDTAIKIDSAAGTNANKSWLINATQADSLLRIGSENNPTSLVIKGSDGNVGIGTATPSSKLHVYGGDAIINTLNIGLGAGTNNGANISIGLSALSSNTSGVNNTAVGEYALLMNTVGYNNAAFGSRALYWSSGNHNTAIGHYALFVNWSGHSNTAVGLGALRNNSGSNNTAIGFYALYRNTTGTYNIAHGYEAGHYIANGSTFNATGDYNIFLGPNTKALADNDQNEIVIGYNATGAGSNSAVLGSDSVTKTILKGAVEFKVSGSNTFAVATNGSISSSTGASLSSGGTWTDASTRELKQDIKDLDYRVSLNIIKQLNPVKFAYKKDPKNKKIGFIAEDVPDLVATEDRKGLSALQIVSALTKVVQSQQKEIQQLKRMVKRLNKIK